jgi:hypothetical protein
MQQGPVGPSLAAPLDLIEVDMERFLQISNARHWTSVY